MQAQWAGFFASNIRDAGAALLSAVLKVNGTLTALRLDGNKIGAAGATALSKALEVNCTLTEVDLYGNHISEEALATITSTSNRNRQLKPTT